MSTQGLHETDAALDQAAREQAVVREGNFARLSAVHFVDGFWLSGDVHEFGRAGLHFEGHLEGIDAGGDSGSPVAFKPFRSNPSRHRAKRAIFRGHAGGIGKKENGVALRAELDALINRGQETAAPAGGPRSAGRRRRASRRTGQVLGLAAEAVIQPGTHAGRPI